MKLAVKRLLVVIALLAGMQCSILAAAEHHGVVKFGGLPVPGASVTISHGERKLTAITDQEGAYAFSGLTDGTWTLRVEMLCFEPVEREIAVGPEAPSPEWELKLLPFDQIQAVAPPPAPPVQTAAAAPAPKPGKRSRNGKAPAPVPSNPTSGFQRTEVNASASSEKEEKDADKPAEEAGGDAGPNAADGFLINGSVNNGAATPFAQASAFGNKRRGQRSLYNGGIGMTFGNSAWNARAFSLTGQDTPKPAYSHMTGLVSFGGPIKIPRLIPRNGPNLVLNYQWTRNRNATTSSGLMPTALERGGDFAATVDAQGRPVRLIDPSNGVPFPGNRLPQDRLSAQARALLGLYPLPNFASGRYNFQAALVGSTHQDALQTRIAKPVGRKNQVSGSYAMQSTRSDSTSLFGFLDTTRALGWNAAANWMHRFSQRTFATFGYQFSRMSNTGTPFFADRRNISALAGIGGNNQEPENWGPPNLNFAGGIAALTEVQSSATRFQTGSVSTSVFRSHGSHNLTIGADYRRQQFNIRSQQDARGTFTFTGAAAGNDFAGFLLGIPDTSSIAFGNADKYFRSASYDAYFSDDWRFSPALTINAGFRWEYSAPIVEKYDRLVNLDTTPGFSAIAPVLASAPFGSLTGEAYPDSLLRPHKRAFQPRIGISWRPLLASSMVVRAGYGVYYDTSIYLPIATRMAQQPPLSKTLSIQNSASNPLTLADGFNAPPSLIPNTFAVDPAFRPGYSQNWQVSVQRDLPWSLVITATYLGIKGTHAQQQFLPNTFPAGAVNPCPACPTGYSYLTSNGNSSRHSGVFQLRRRLHSGFTANLQYTWSKAIDDAALGGRGAAAGAAVIAQDWLNLAGERGLSPFDQRHLLNAQIQYTTGMGLGGGTLIGSWRGALLKDWTFATQITAGSGLPLTPIYLAAVHGTGVTGTIRPDYTGAPLYDAYGGRFLNPAAVAPPAEGRWGNAGRNSITGPGQFTLNASMARTFRLGDRLNADFRIEAVNALNHVTFPTWNTTIASAQFGLPMTANPMRSLQSTVRVRF